MGLGERVIEGEGDRVKGGGEGVIRRELGAGEGGRGWAGGVEEIREVSVCGY